MRKRLIALFMTLTMVFSMAIPSSAVDAEVEGDRPLLRSDLAIISVELAGLADQLSVYAGQAKFIDVPADAEYAPYVTTAYAAGLLTKIGNTPLLPADEDAINAIEDEVAAPAESTDDTDKNEPAIPTEDPTDVVEDGSVDAVLPKGATEDEEYDRMREMRLGAEVTADDVANAFGRFAATEPLADPGVFDPARQLTQREVIAFLLRYAGYKDAQLGFYPNDYESLAKSVGLLNGFDYSAEESITADQFSTLLTNVKVLYDALHAEVKEPLFVDGMAQPIFDYDDVLRFCVYVETNYDTDGDGKLDLVKALVQLPQEVLDGMKIATIYEARPYATGCVNQRLLNYGTEGYDVASMYATPEARTPSDTKVSTKEAAESAVRSDYFYFNSYDGGEWEYEDLTWYDYYLIRGFAVVTSGGIGTMGSEGFETCGSDLEIDAFQCIVEWLNGDPDRIAYTDKTNNNPIEADWSNNNIGMTGRSYSGTTQFGLATTGVQGLKTIVPVAGIASWYEYTNSQGIATGKVNYTEGLGFYCNGRYIDQTDWATIKDDYENYMNQQKMDQLALNGDYGDHWAVRDYTTNWAKIQCPALIVHGLNDTNVRTKEFDLMYNAFMKAGQSDTKLLLHQGTHLTPTKHNLLPTNDPTTPPDVKMQMGTEMLIGDQLYDEVLNKWFSHYLYGVDNGANKMATVTAQSNVDGTWEEYDTWNAGTNDVKLKGAADAPETTAISSNHRTNGITNWKNAFIAGPTACSTYYSMDVTENMVINGPIAVHIRASSDAIADPSKMSAMLVDKNATPFLSYNPSGSYLPTNILEPGGVWLGSGLRNFDLFEYKQTPAAYKVIAEGWMDLNNPKAGYDSYTAVKDDTYVAGEMHDYTLYLQPNLYTVVSGHELALIVYTTSSTPSTHYSITFDNAATYATIPTFTETKQEESVGGGGDGGSFISTYAITASAGSNGSVTPNGTTQVVKSGSQTYTIKADDGYMIEDVRVDGKSMGAIASYTFSDIREAHIISATFVKQEVAPPVVNPFTDVAKDAFYYDAVLWANKNGIAMGTSETAFAPMASCSRSQVVTFLWRANGSPEPKSMTSPFADVTDANAYDYRAVLWAAEQGITSGTSATNFDPTATVTRGQFVTFLWRSASKPLSAIETPFTDVSSDAFSYSAILWAAEQGITSGTSATTFTPDGSCQRGQVVTLLYRYMGNQSMK